MLNKEQIKKLDDELDALVRDIEKKTIKRIKTKLLVFGLSLMVIGLLIVICSKEELQGKYGSSIFGIGTGVVLGLTIID